MIFLLSIFHVIGPAIESKEISLRYHLNHNVQMYTGFHYSAR